MPHNAEMASSPAALPPLLPRNASALVLLEHVNLTQPDQQLATLFYVVGLGFTRDPFLMVGLDNMWINIGRTQMHLPTRRTPQRLRGSIGLTVPWQRELPARLASLRPLLAQTSFDLRDAGDLLEVRCPWGNVFKVHASAPGETLPGLAYVELEVPAGAAAGIGRFYTELLDAPATLLALEDGLQQAVVPLASGQSLRFAETRSSLPPYDGHHLQLYLDRPEEAHRRLGSLGLLQRDRGAQDWRFTQLVDPADGRPLYELEHEMRGCSHPLYGRRLVNRNPAQQQSSYRPGEDELPDGPR